MSAIDATYQAQRIRLTRVVVNAATAILRTGADQATAVAQIVPVVEAGQSHAVQLVSAYMTAKALTAGAHDAQVTLDPARYTTTVLRGAPADVVYQRPFSVLQAALARTKDPMEALQSGRAQVASLAATDLQLAQTHAARDWMQEVNTTRPVGAPRIVGYRRALTGPGPHCPLCELAATRTYRESVLLPIHEHCGCTVEPLWGTEPVASVGTSVRVEHDPELGPRLMADSWSSVGPRLID